MKNISSRLKHLYTDAFLDTYLSSDSHGKCNVLPIVMVSQIVDIAFDVVAEQDKYRSFIKPFTAKNITAFAVAYATSRNEFISNIPLKDSIRKKIVWEIDRLLKFTKYNTQWAETLYKSLNNGTWFKMDV